MSRKRLSVPSQRPAALTHGGCWGPNLTSGRCTVQATLTFFGTITQGVTGTNWLTDLKTLRSGSSSLTCDRSCLRQQRIRATFRAHGLSQQRDAHLVIWSREGRLGPRHSPGRAARCNLSCRFYRISDGAEPRYGRSQPFRATHAMGYRHRNYPYRRKNCRRRPQRRHVFHFNERTLSLKSNLKQVIHESNPDARVLRRYAEQHRSSASGRIPRKPSWRMNDDAAAVRKSTTHPMLFSVPWRWLVIRAFHLSLNPLIYSRSTSESQVTSACRRTL